MKTKVKHQLHATFVVVIEYRTGEVITENLTMRQYNAIGQRKTYSTIKRVFFKGKVKL